MSEAPENTEVEAIEPVEAAQQGGEQQVEDFEDRAMAMGWTPKSQFKGDPENWVDAETFVKRGEEFLPFLKANNRRLEQALERANAKIEQMDSGLKKAIQQLSTSEKRAYARARSELEAELAQRTEAGDVEGVRAVTKDLVDLERETAAKAEEKPEATPHPDFVAWKEGNEWYGKDKALSAAFDALCEEVAEEGYTKPKAGLKEATERLKAAFPEKFAKPVNANRNGPGAVEGGGAPPRPRGRTYADLPPEARQMCDELVKDIKGFTREKYVKEYFAQEEKK